MKRLSVQEIVDMGARRYDEFDYTRQEIREWLESLLELGLAKFNIELVYDLIVG